ncbi:MAG: radical SAM protein [Elusimicrobiota bacterium]|jgi:MoaA/NifB/PqqE/SkfB family radical SAM enzyme
MNSEAASSVRRMGREESLALNAAESKERKILLSAPPRLITLGAHSCCNARCVFCPEGKFPRFSLARYKEFFEARLGHFIRQAEKVTFTGFGETLWMPEAAEFLDYLNETIPETWKIFTTNGTPLRPAVIERLLKSKYAIQVSLHASKPDLHEALTGLRGAFEPVVSGVRELCRMRKEQGLGQSLHVVLVDVLTTRNIDDLPDFVRMARSLDVPEVQCSYVTAFEEAHLPLSCFFEPDRANRAIAAAEAVIEGLRKDADPEEFKHFSVRLPQRFGAGKDDLSDAVCPEPWEHVYVEGQGPVLPCCQWGEHVGNLERGDDMDALWNSPFYQGLRRAMVKGPLHPWCAQCSRHRGWNVDRLASHLTNRPEAQARLTLAARRMGLPVELSLGARS